MSKLTTIAVLVAGIAARYPSLDPGTVDLQAGEDSVDLQAAAFRPFSAAGKTVHIKATEHFFVAGQVITKDDIVEVPEGDARHIIGMDKAALATDDEIAAAKAEPAKKASK